MAKAPTREDARFFANIGTFSETTGGPNLAACLRKFANSDRCFGKRFLWNVGSGRKTIQIAGEKQKTKKFNSRFDDTAEIADLGCEFWCRCSGGRATTRPSPQITRTRKKIKLIPTRREEKTKMTGNSVA